jgi:hypothetical protein
MCTPAPPRLHALWRRGRAASALPVRAWADRSRPPPPLLQVRQGPPRRHHGPVECAHERGQHRRLAGRRRRAGRRLGLGVPGAGRRAGRRGGPDLAPARGRAGGCRPPAGRPQRAAGAPPSVQAPFKSSPPRSLAGSKGLGCSEPLVAAPGVWADARRRPAGTCRPSTPPPQQASPCANHLFC